MSSSSAAVSKYAYFIPSNAILVDNTGAIYVTIYVQVIMLKPTKKGAICRRPE